MRRLVEAVGLKLAVYGIEFRHLLVTACSVAAIMAIFELLKLLVVTRDEPAVLLGSVACTAVLPFAMLLLFYPNKVKEQTFAVTVGILATFLGASLAFIQADYQSRVSDKEILMRQIDRSLDVLKVMNEAWSRPLEEVSKMEFRESSYALVSTLLASDKLSEFFTPTQIYDLDYAFEAIMVMGSTVGHPKPEMDAKTALGNLQIAHRGLYGDLCTLKQALLQKFDLHKLGRYPPGLFMEGTLERWNTAPAECRSVPEYTTIFYTKPAE